MVVFWPKLNLERSFLPLCRSENSNSLKFRSEAPVLSNRVNAEPAMQLVLVSMMSLHRRTGHADGRTCRMTRFSLRLFLRHALEVECMAQSTTRLIIAMCYSLILCLIACLRILRSTTSATPHWEFFRILLQNFGAALVVGDVFIQRAAPADVDF